MGISGTAKMRKGDLVAAIKARQNGESGPASAGEPRRQAASPTPPARSAPSAPPPERRRCASSAPSSAAPARSAPTAPRPASAAGGDRQDRGEGSQQRSDRQDRGERREITPAEPPDTQNRDTQNRDTQNRDGQTQGGQQGQGAPQQRQGSQGAQGFQDDEEGRGGRRRRNRGRNRDKRRTPGQEGAEADAPVEQQITEDDVLVPVAGILDILDSYAFVRTTGYLPGSSDIYVPLTLVKRHGLRKGDAVTGSIKATREGEDPQQQTVGGRNNRAKYTPLARLDTVNGMAPDEARRRPEFGKLTPALPPGPTAPGDRAEHHHDADHRPRRPDRQGPARPDRRPGQGRQDDGHAGARQRDHDEQPRVPPHGRPRRRASRGGHRHAARRQGRCHLLDLRLARRRPHHGRRARHRARRAPRRDGPPRRRVLRLDHQARSAYNLSAPASGRILSGGVDSAALYLPKSSSAPRATSRTAAR